MRIFGKEKGQPSEFRLAQVAVCGGMNNAAYWLTSNGFGHLLPYWNLDSPVPSRIDSRFGLLVTSGLRGDKGEP